MLPLLRHRAARTLALLAAGTLLSACTDGLQLEGKLFDWMGVSSAALEAKTQDPKMADRAPLVVPPRLTRLPEPGSGKAGNDELAALADPEQRKAEAAKERERLHLAYCRGEKQWKEKALDPNYSGSRSPYGPCPGLLSGVTNNLTK